jgi:hypothetical protein
MIDMGIVHGERVFYTGGRSLAQLIQDGEVCAVPTDEGLAFKRTEICTPLELEAKCTLDEVRAFAEKYGANE